MARKKKNGNGNGNNVEKENLEETIIVKKTTKKQILITPKTQHQKELLQSIEENIVTIVYGPAGSGKSRISVVCGLKEFIEGKYKKLIFTRPCVEANGENLGFLPGNLNEKIHPYMYPIFDFLSEYLAPKQIEDMMKLEKIMTLPLAFMRGVTLKNAFVIFDEGQNSIPKQMRMFLTRIGDNCKVVINGDPDQSDIKIKNGLVDACERLEGVNGLKIIKFDETDIVRHPIVVEIEERYKEKE